jgi:hypothetical protein
VFEAAPHPETLQFAIAAIAIAASLAFVALHHWRQKRAERAASWPSTPGIVTSSRTARRWGLGNGMWIAGLWYVPEVAYRYEVAGKALTGRKVTLSDTGYPKLRAAREVIDRYKPGDGVDVFYDPARPKRACLEPKSREQRSLGIAALLVVIAAAALIAG